MDNLARRLDAFMESLTERVGTKTAALLSDAGRAEDAPKVGDMAPDFELPNQCGRVVSLAGLRERGPVVVTFFRGNWCPFCSLALRALDQARPELTKLGASLVAISPQTADLAALTTECNALRFPVLADAGNAVARRWGLAWQLGPEHQAVYGRLGHPLPRYNGTEDWTLPIPAGFVVGRDGRITYAHVDARITRRLDPRLAVDAVRSLAVSESPSVFPQQGDQPALQLDPVGGEDLRLVAGVGRLQGD